VQIKGSDNNAGNLEITFNNNATQDVILKATLVLIVAPPAIS
jgi:hypothetical protein